MKLEDLGKKLSSTGQEALQKTKDMAEIVRLNGVIAGKEKSLGGCCQKIGQQYLELHADGPEEALAPLIAEALGLQGEIEELRQEVRKLRGVAPCAACGADVDNASPFCPACGAQNVNYVSPAENTGPVCPQCGAPVAQDAKFCTSCGKRLEQAPAEE